MKKLVIIGASGFGRETAWLVERINNINPTWELLGYLDDDETLTGSISYKYRILGTSQWLKDNTDTYAVCAIGAAKTRKSVVNRISSYGNIKYATLIDPSVATSDSNNIGCGTIICAYTTMTVNVDIGDHVIINLNCTVGHEVIINDFVTLYPNVNISGACIIKGCVEIGTGTQIIQGLTVAENITIGAGAVVVDNLTNPGVYVGVPAKKLNK